MNKQQKTILFSGLLFVLAVGYLTYWHVHAQQAQPGSYNTNSSTDLTGQSCTTGSFNVYTPSSGTASLQFCQNGVWGNSPVVRAFDQTGNSISGVHFTTGTGTLALGRATVTLSGNAVYTSATSYVCQVSDTSGISLITVISQASGSQFTVGAVSLGLADNFSFLCAGN